MHFSLGTWKFCLFWGGGGALFWPTQTIGERKLMSYKYYQWKTVLEGKKIVFSFFKDGENICDLCTLLIIKDILKASSFYPPFSVVTVQKSQCNLICSCFAHSSLHVADCVGLSILGFAAYLALRLMLWILGKSKYEKDMNLDLWNCKIFALPSL